MYYYYYQLKSYSQAEQQVPKGGYDPVHYEEREKKDFKLKEGILEKLYPPTKPVNLDMGREERRDKELHQAIAKAKSEDELIIYIFSMSDD